MNKWCIPPEIKKGSSLDEDFQTYTFYDDIDKNPIIQKVVMSIGGIVKRCWDRIELRKDWW